MLSTYILLPQVDNLHNPLRSSNYYWEVDESEQRKYSN